MKVKIDCTGRIDFTKLEEVGKQAAGTLCVPKSKIQQGIDGILMPDDLFQVTVDLDHKIASHGVNQAYKVPSYYFALP